MMKFNTRKKSNVITMDDAVQILSERLWEREIDDKKYDRLARKAFEIHQQTELIKTY